MFLLMAPAGGPMTLVGSAPKTGMMGRRVPLGGARNFKGQGVKKSAGSEEASGCGEA
jgi:hypothetical protein